MQFERDMASNHRALFESARAILTDTYALKETQKERITTYSDAAGGICHMRTMKHGIDIGFLKGARMADVHGLLSGTGKIMRVLSLECLDEISLRYYLDQAIEINAQTA